MAESFDDMTNEEYEKWLDDLFDLDLFKERKTNSFNSEETLEKMDLNFIEQWLRKKKMSNIKNKEQ